MAASILWLGARLLLFCQSTLWKESSLNHLFGIKPDENTSVFKILHQGCVPFSETASVSWHETLFDLLEHFLTSISAKHLWLYYYKFCPKWALQGRFVFFSGEMLNLLNGILVQLWLRVSWLIHWSQLVDKKLNFFRSFRLLSELMGCVHTQHPQND